MALRLSLGLTGGGQFAPYAGTAAATALRQSTQRRVDLVMIGDSNQLFGGYGYGAAFSKKLVQRYGMYATQIGTGEGDGGGNSFSTSNAFVLTGVTVPTAADGTMAGVSATLAAAALTSFAVDGGTPTAGYGFVASGSSIAAGTTGGLNIGNVAGVNVSARWRFWYGYGTFATGTGSFRPEVRLGGSPFSTLASATTISTNTGAEGYVLGSLDISAAARTTSVEFRLTRPSGTAVTGPALIHHYRAENLDATTGISVTTLYGMGGQSLYDMAYQLQNVTTAFLTNHFTEIRRLQVNSGLDPLVVVYISSGANDRNEASAPSLGPNPASPGDSSAAYADNLAAIVNRIEAIWTAQSWNLSNLQFLVVPTHPLATPDDSEIVSYRAAAQTYAASRSRVTVIDISRLTTYAAINGSGWVDSGGVPHLKSAGYDAISNMILSSMGL